MRKQTWQLATEDSAGTQYPQWLAGRVFQCVICQARSYDALRKWWTVWTSLHVPFHHFSPEKKTPLLLIRLRLDLQHVRGAASLPRPLIKNSRRTSGKKNFVTKDKSQNTTNIDQYGHSWHDAKVCKSSFYLIASNHLHWRILVKMGPSSSNRGKNNNKRSLKYHILVLDTFRLPVFSGISLRGAPRNASSDSVTSKMECLATQRRSRPRPLQHCNE